MSSSAAPTTKTFGKSTRSVPHPSEKAQKWYPAEDEGKPRKVRWMHASCKLIYALLEFGDFGLGGQAVLAGLAFFFVVVPECGELDCDGSHENLRDDIFERDHRLRQRIHEYMSTFLRLGLVLTCYTHSGPQDPALLDSSPVPRARHRPDPPCRSFPWQARRLAQDT